MVLHFKLIAEATLKGHHLTIVARDQNSKIKSLLLTDQLAFFNFDHTSIVMRFVLLI